MASSHRFVRNHLHPALHDLGDLAREAKLHYQGKEKRLSTLKRTSLALHLAWHFKAKPIRISSLDPNLATDLGQASPASISFRLGFCHGCWNGLKV